MTAKMLMTLFGGLGLFLYGMTIMSDGLKNIAGDRMKRLLEILTNNRLMGILVGTIVTAIIQSSSATTVMVVGFVNAGLMNLLQATGVIMGANIGTTITAQLIAFKITDYATLAIGLGTILYLFAKKNKTKQIGGVILGFGILFIGMNFMSDSMKPLRDYEGFKTILISFSKNPFLGVLAGFVFTAIIQSSSASIGLLQALAISGAFNNVPNPLQLIVPILMGQNIGTCVTSMLSSIGASISAKRASFIHLLFNVIGTIVFLMILWIGRWIFKGDTPIFNFIVSISGTTTLNGQVVADISRQIANFHTLFNISNTIILLPFGKFLVRIAEKVLAGEEKEDLGGLKFLDERILENPAIAVGQVVKETVRMGRIALENMNRALQAFFTGNEKLIEEVFEKEKIINQLNRDITHYLIKLSNSNLSEKDEIRTTNLYHTLSDIERIGDHSENLAELAQYKIEHNLSFSNIAFDELKGMVKKINNMISDVITSLETDDIDLAKTIYEKEDEVDKLEENYRAEHIQRLNRQLCHPSSGVIFLDVLSNLERIADHATNISKTVLDLKEV
ncbi:Na/Pi cotransporter family protein [Garciella nitratireducens]|uniref:Phosphate:Na+ symporter n=1 Tax=Garciella nitratireducens DSM 15102 TaxID=1121911 RepID=A0A1T4KKZ3_9FIRM|nr:Na/Pi cotransporter family protein [Garciella nitratireducens]SJZ43058.1 phosphate:Na+ symporter [Garciella nitratireducens DSM 15102]